MLEAALCAFDAEEVEALTADPELISVSWLRRLQVASIPFVIRLRSDRPRWEVEILFAALKSRGVDLETTHLTAPDRVRRLIGLFAVAFV